MKITAPFSIRPQDKRVLSLVRHGEATDAALFEAQFGEWPVRGINISQTSEAQEKILFKPFSARPHKKISSLFTSLAQIDPSDTERVIYINGGLLNPATPILGLFASRLAWARLHDLIEPLLGIRTGPVGIAFLGLGLLSSYRYAMISALTHIVTPSLADIVGEEHIHLLQYRDPLDNIARNPFLAEAQNDLKNLPTAARTWNEFCQVYDAFFTLMPRAYYAQDAEMQARLHNILVRGYKAWGKLPETQDELYAALYDMGIKTPNIVADYLNRKDNNSLRDAFQKHSSLNGYFDPPNAELNIGLNHFRDRRILESYWRDALPYLYADLLEKKYGDTSAFQRMGFSQETDMVGLPLRLPAPSL